VQLTVVLPVKASSPLLSGSKETGMPYSVFIPKLISIAHRQVLSALINACCAGNDNEEMLK